MFFLGSFLCAHHLIVDETRTKGCILKLNPGTQITPLPDSTAYGSSSDCHYTLITTGVGVGAAFAFGLVAVINSCKGNLEFDFVFSANLFLNDF